MTSLKEGGLLLLREVREEVSCPREDEIIKRIPNGQNARKLCACEMNAPGEKERNPEKKGYTSYPIEAGVPAPLERTV